MMAFAPPVVANGNAQAVLNAAVDLPEGPANVRVTRSAKRRKLAEGLLATGDITEAEYGDHEGFHSCCVAAATADGGGAPAWFAPALDAALAPALAPIKATLEKINSNLVNINARQGNAVAVHQNDVLTPLNNDAGILDPNFPATLQALNNMDGVALAAILGHYNLPAGGAVAARRDRFKKFIGIRL